MIPKTAGIDAAQAAYTQSRKAHWNTVAGMSLKFSAMRRCYHHHLIRIYRKLVPPGLRVLEVGSGSGDLLASLDAKEGVGLDFSPVMVDQARQKYAQFKFIEQDLYDITANQLPDLLNPAFDIIILSDVINDLWDVQQAMERLKCLCAPHTRLIINFHSQLWEVPAEWAQRFGFMTPRLEQNWLTTDDMRNLARLSGFDVIRSFDAFFWPWNTPVIEPLCNRWLASIPPFRWLCLMHFMIGRIDSSHLPSSSVSVVIPARNEAGNITAAINRIPEMGAGTEIIFVEGHSSDNTWEVIQNTIGSWPQRSIRAFRQQGKGKGDAVRLGFEQAKGDVLMILDADLTVAPEMLPQFYNILVSGKAEFVNGVRLVYPMEGEAMRFFNLLGNKFFSLAFSWLLEQPIKDTLCGTKVLSRENYHKIANNRKYFGEFDPFGDFDLIFGAAKLNLKIADLPVRYLERKYGQTNISRWRDGWILLKMTIFAARRIKFL